MILNGHKIVFWFGGILGAIFLGCVIYLWQLCASIERLCRRDK
jgi:hypothetical protein